MVQTSARSIDSNTSTVIGHAPILTLLYLAVVMTQVHAVYVYVYVRTYTYAQYSILHAGQQWRRGDASKPGPWTLDSGLDCGLKY